MARLPQPGGDNGTWGDILNDFLKQSHNDDGTIKASAISSKADDSAVVHKTGDETVTGVKTFSSSPAAPDPTSGSDLATKDYVDNTASSGAPDADASTKGLIQLAGDLGGTAASPQIATGVIVNADINASAAIAQSKISNLTTDLSAKADDSAVLHKSSNLSDVASASTARTNLGLAIGSDVEAHDTDLTTIAGLTPINDDVIQRKAGAWANRSTSQLKTDLSLTKSDVGLGNVDNTSDATKPVSTATQTALNLKAPLASPTFTGTVTVPTPTNPTDAATKGYVDLNGSGDASTNTSSSVDGEITLFSGTGGKTLKRATGSGIVKASSGVYSTTTAPSGTVVGDSDTQTLSNKTVDNSNSVTTKDANFTLQDDGDTTKQLKFQLSGLSTSTTRTLTVPDASGTLALTSNDLSAFGSTTSAQLASVISNETGTGSLVFSDSPALTTPDLGTPSAINLSNATGLSISSVSGLGTGVSTFLGTPSSANLASAVTDETGSGGALVFASSPTITTPTIGSFTNATHTHTNAAGGGQLTDSALSAAVGISKGGTGQTTAGAALGGSGLNVESRQTFSNTAYSVNSTDRFVAQTGTMSAARTATLPAANSVAAGYQIIIADESGSVTSTNKISITRAGSDTIDGATSLDIISAYGFRVLRSDGTNKWTITGQSIEGDTNLESIIRANSLDQMTAAAGNVNLNSNKIINLATATSDGDAVKLSQLQQVSTFSNADYTVLSTDRYVIQTGTMSASRTATLPLANTVHAGKVITVYDGSGSVTPTNSINVSVSGSDTLAGGFGTSAFIFLPFGVLDVISDGTSKWYSVLYQNVKRILTRPTALTSSATPTVNTDNADIVSITALATNITSMTTNLSGNPGNGDRLRIRILDNGSARTITWGTSFASKGAILPTTTVASKLLTVMLEYDSVTTKWGCLAVAQEA